MKNGLRVFHRFAYMIISETIIKQLKMSLLNNNSCTFEITEILWKSRCLSLILAFSDSSLGNPLPKKSAEI